jgi:hypothetical protein
MISIVTKNVYRTYDVGDMPEDQRVHFTRTAANYITTWLKNDGECSTVAADIMTVAVGSIAEASWEIMKGEREKDEFEDYEYSQARAEGLEYIEWMKKKGYLQQN